MATLAENVAAVKAAQVAIDAAIVAKGGTTDGGLANAAAAIENIPSGGKTYGSPFVPPAHFPDIRSVLDSNEDAYKYKCIALFDESSPRGLNFSKASDIGVEKYITNDGQTFMSGGYHDVNPDANGMRWIIYLGNNAPIKIGYFGMKADHYSWDYVENSTTQSFPLWIYSNTELDIGSGGSIYKSFFGQSILMAIEAKSFTRDDIYVGKCKRLVAIYSEDDEELNTTNFSYCNNLVYLPPLPSNVILSTDSNGAMSLASIRLKDNVFVAGNNPGNALRLLKSLIICPDLDLSACDTVSVYFSYFLERIINFPKITMNVTSSGSFTLRLASPYVPVQEAINTNDTGEIIGGLCYTINDVSSAPSDRTIQLAVAVKTKITNAGLYDLFMAEMGRKGWTVSWV